MIFPILRGLVHWSKAPVTWALFALISLVFVYTSLQGYSAQVGLEELMRKPYFLTAQGRAYAQFLVRQNEGEYPEFLLKMGREIDEGRLNKSEMLGQLAFRDQRFMLEADSLDLKGDQVAFKLWRKHLKDIELFQDEHPSFTLGLNAQDENPLRWVTYIFVHSGLTHFVGNMLFLLLFGAALEQVIGGLGMLVVFVLSGLVSAGVFALMTGVTSSPLVGASGSISGVMALFCLLTMTRPVRFFYWFFLPMRGAMGFVYLPAWIVLALWVISDTAGYLGTLPELGGVAHTAHLGGEIAGLVTALCLWAMRWQSGRNWIQESGPTPPVGVLIPFLPRAAATPHSEQSLGA